MSALALPAGLSKEVRALAPMWALCLAGIGAAVVAPGGFPEGLIVYVFGTLALGSQSIGHEFSNRTLPLILSQPVDRRRLYRLKAAALVPMVLTVVLAGIWILPRNTRVPDDFPILLAPLCALFVTPWLTMVTRSGLAGIVFTLGAPAMLALIANLLIGAPATVGIAAALVLCVVGALDGWRRFTHLEAIETPAPSFHMPAAIRRFAARPRHPALMLVFKELQLQQMTFAIAGLYVVGWLLWYPMVRSSPGAANPLEVLTPIYVVLLMLVMGSLTSAEERHLGTIDWQLLMPFAAWKQWAIKMTVIAGLAALLGIGIPSLVAMTMSGSPEFVTPLAGSLVLLLTAGSIYISSLCRTAIRAIVTSLAVLPLSLALYVSLLAAMIRVALMTAGSFGGVSINYMRTTTFHGSTSWAAGTIPAITLVVAVTALLVHYAYLNHRTASPPADRIARQLLVIGAALTLGGMTVALFIVSAP